VSRGIREVYTYVYTGGAMLATKVGVREFREQIARYLEFDSPVAVTRRGETLGVYVPTPRKSRQDVDTAELRAAARRLAEALSDVGEDEIVAEFKGLRRAERRKAR
jgi:PHD/YefM family antitoxin component YafN of YafNO toxin-antitoxin module